MDCIKIIRSDDAVHDDGLWRCTKGKSGRESELRAREKWRQRESEKLS